MGPTSSGAGREPSNTDPLRLAWRVANTESVMDVTMKMIGRPGGGFRQHGCSRASTEGSLAAHAAKGGGDVGTLPALQQHHDDQEQTNNDVNHGEQDNHVVLNPRIRRPRCTLYAPASAIS